MPDSTPPHRALSIRLGMDDNDSPSDAIDALFLSRFVTGEQPYSCGTSLDRVKSGAVTGPAGRAVLRSAQDKDRGATLAEGDGWTILRLALAPTGRRDGDRGHEELAEERPGRGRRRRRGPAGTATRRRGHGLLVRPPRRGPHRITRQITAGPWDDVRGNYTAPVAEAMDGLMKLTPDDVSGRLLLLHGPPGTGKTSALRTLARAWRDWCQVDCVLDPEGSSTTSAT